MQFKKNYFFILIAFLFLFAFPVLASEVDGTISPNPSFAYGENLGWINFGCDNCNVHVLDTGLTGFAWSPQHGWINLAPTGSGVTVNCLGQLGGKAWSKSLGWIDFSGASINAVGRFTGLAGIPATKAGRVSFDCDNSCNVVTDWRQCALRSSPALVSINAITDNTVPSIAASISIKNEGLIDTEYFYDWCVVSDIANPCGGGDDIYFGSASKDILPGVTWTAIKNATVPVPGNYYFKLVVHWGVNFSLASEFFTAINGGGGGGGGGTVVDACPNIAGFQNSIPLGYISVDGQCVLSSIGSLACDGADFNHDGRVDSVDFSILLYFWKQNPPFKNVCVDINKDNKVDSVDFSILLSQWGRRP